MSILSGMTPFGQMPTGDEHGPTNEIGQVVNQFIVPGWNNMSEVTDDLEENPKLIFPASVNTYHNMRTDPQMQGLLTGSTWPLLRMKWFLKPNGAREEAVNKLSADLNLPVSVSGKGDDIDNFNQRRRQNRFNFLDHLEAALDALAYGFGAFEQVGHIGPDGLFHYKKLSPRLPQTIVEMKVADDGGLEWIKQGFANSPPIPMDRLVVYAFQKRGANWHGRSLFRGCYGPWLLKDRAMRVGVMNIQRSGVGTPIAQGAPGMTDPDLRVLDQMMRRLQSGDRSGGAIPYGASVKLVGVEGSQPDTVGFINLMNEEMARSFFQMFMQLGQSTTGSRALGQTFVDYHKLVIEFIAQWFTNIFNEHVIEDDIEWNYGPEEEFAPLLGWAWDSESAIEDQKSTKADNPEPSVVPPASADPTFKLRQDTRDGKVTLPAEIAAAINV